MHDKFAQLPCTHLPVDSAAACTAAWRHIRKTDQIHENRLVLLNDVYDYMPKDGGEP